MNKKILIIEDDKDILETLQELLESQGYLIALAENGLDALKVLRDSLQLPDLILLDYMMPEMDGASFRVEQIKDRRISEIPVLLMTADAHPDLKRAQIGARDFVKKPLDIDKFLASVEKCINS